MVTPVAFISLHRLLLDAAILSIAVRVDHIDIFNNLQSCPMSISWNKIVS
jgi:hypothetical protein